MKNDQLDDILQAWAQRREYNEQKLQKVTARIMQSLPRRPGIVPPAHEPAMRIHELWPRAACFAIGAAAMLVIILGINMARSRSLVQISSTSGLSGNYAVSKAMVIREMNSLFSGQLLWVAENNGTIKVGINPEAGMRKDDLTSAWVQTVVVTRQAGETAWQPIWSTTVQVHNNEQIELPSLANSDGRLMFWVYALDNDKWAIDSVCALTTPVRLTSESSKIIETGKYQEIAALKTEDREYLVFQTVLNMKPDRSS